MRLPLCGGIIRLTFAQVHARARRRPGAPRREYDNGGSDESARPMPLRRDHLRSGGGAGQGEPVPLPRLAGQAAVYSCAPQNPKTYSLRVGALSEPDALGRPASEIWTKRRLSWMPKLDGATQMEGQP